MNLHTLDNVSYVKAPLSCHVKIYGWINFIVGKGMK